MTAPESPEPENPPPASQFGTIRSTGRPADPPRHPTLGTQELSPLAVKVFGDYEIQAEIARGGMGIVYKARHLALNRIVALKVTRAAGELTLEERQRFQVEVEAVATLDHPNIVPIFEVGAHEGQPFFTMKLVEGGTLAKRLADFRLPQPHEATVWTQAQLQKRHQHLVALMITVCRAVDHAHQRGVLHRDLKPGNILIDEQGQPHVTDFGLAKKQDQAQDLTTTGALMGTPYYMPPEQARGEKGLTTAADVYSLGAILYELLTGHPPFRDRDLYVLLQKVQDEEPAPPRQLNPQADPDLATVALKCLEKAPERRYHSAEELARDLERWRDGSPITARPTTLPERMAKWARRKPAWAALAAVSVLAAAMLFALPLLFARQQLLAEQQEAAEAALQHERQVGQERERALAAEKLARAQEEKAARAVAQALEREKQARAQEAQSRTEAEAARRQAEAARQVAVNAVRDNAQRILVMAGGNQKQRQAVVDRVLKEIEVLEKAGDTLGTAQLRAMLLDLQNKPKEALKALEAALPASLADATHQHLPILLERTYLALNRTDWEDKSVDFYLAPALQALKVTQEPGTPAEEKADAEGAAGWAYCYVADQERELNPTQARKWREQAITHLREALKLRPQPDQRFGWIWRYFLALQVQELSEDKATRSKVENLRPAARQALDEALPYAPKEEQQAIRELRERLAR